MPQNKILSEKLQGEVSNFFEYAAPARLSRNLRKLLIGYLLACDEGHGFDMKDLLSDLSALFELLDTAADEIA